MAKWAELSPAAQALARLVWEKSEQPHQEAQIKALTALETELAALSPEDCVRLVRAAQHTARITRYNVTTRRRVSPTITETFAQQLRLHKPAEER